jgi:hypothetical protein
VHGGVDVMRGRRSKATVLERDIAELAEHALDAAREVGHHAGPALHHSAEGLSHALEKAAASLAETADRFAETGDQRAGGATHAARARLADASERFAEAVRPKKKHHRIRNILIATVAIGGVIAFVQSPLRAKLTARLFGPPPEEEPSSITLPNEETIRAEVAGREQSDAEASSSNAEGDGVSSVASISAETARD